MKTPLITTAIVVIAVLSFNRAGFAQYGMTQMQMMQHFNAQNKKMMKLYQQQQQKHQQKMKQLLKQYRKETGDTKSTDQQIIQRMTIESKRRYPQQWAAIHRRQMQMNQDNFNKRQAMIKETNDHINKTYQSSNAYRRKSIEHTNNMFSDYMRGQSTYRNPNTGRTVKLPYPTSNSYYHNYNSGNSYYSSPNGTYYQYNNGYRTQLNPYHR